MKKMKRFAALVLAGALVLCLLAGCSGGGSGKSLTDTAESVKSEVLKSISRTYFDNETYQNNETIRTALDGMLAKIQADGAISADDAEKETFVLDGENEDPDAPSSWWEYGMVLTDGEGKAIDFAKAGNTVNTMNTLVEKVTGAYNDLRATQGFVGDFNAFGISYSIVGQHLYFAVGFHAESTLGSLLG